MICWCQNRNTMIKLRLRITLTVLLSATTCFILDLIAELTRFLLFYQLTNLKVQHPIVNILTIIFEKVPIQTIDFSRSALMIESLKIS